ncbi:hypothetical protein [Halospeciosus flavus]|uniref:Uncharacterized protein n=1 Tax=Halospeciosus flavus TaxID=3032283 RepID=A0ABD5Z2A7_9EURY|nr:hypothetical protein [Halospeciosus flavus]
MSSDDAPTGLLDLYRRPLAAPLATLVATAILVAFAHQAFVLAGQVGPLGYVVISVTAAVAYAVAKCGWAVENSIVRAAQDPYRYDAASFDRDTTGTDADDATHRRPSETRR